MLICKMNNGRHAMYRVLRFPESVGADTRGFTMSELLVVLVILGLMTLLAFPAYSKYVNVAKIARASSEIRVLEKAIVSYSLDKGGFPARLEDVGQASLLDPWGTAYVYELVPNPPDGTEYVATTGESLNSDFNLYSMGPDRTTNRTLTVGVSASSDDILRAEDGAFVGQGQDHL